MFRSNPNIQIASMIHENEAFVRGFLQNPRFDDVKTKLSREADWFALGRSPTITSHQLYMIGGSKHGSREFQRSRSERISSMHQFQCTKCFNTCQKKNSTASSKKRKSHLEPSVPLRAQNEQESNPKRRRLRPSRARTNFSPQPPFIRKNIMFRSNPNSQIASMIHENEAFVRGVLRIPRVEEMKIDENEAFVRGFLRIPRVEETLQGMKIDENEAFVRGFLWIPRVEEVKTKLSCEVSFKFQEVKKWTHLFNAPVPMHKVFQHMPKKRIAQHHQRREKVTWNHQFHCARKTNRNRIQSGDAWDRRAREPTFLRNATVINPKKHNVSFKS